MTNRIGDKIKVIAKNIAHNGVIVGFENKTEGKEPVHKTAFLHISKINNRYIRDIEDEIKAGDLLLVELIKTENDKNYVRLIENISKTKREERERKKLRAKQMEEIKKTPFERKLEAFLESSTQRQKEIKKGIERRRNRRLYYKKKRKR